MNERSKAVARRLGARFEKRVPFRDTVAEVFAYDLGAKIVGVDWEEAALSRPGNAIRGRHRSATASAANNAARDILTLSARAETPTGTSLFRAAHRVDGGNAEKVRAAVLEFRHPGANSDAEPPCD